MSKKRKPEPNYKVFTPQPSDNGLSDREKQLRDELEEYRKNHPRPWFAR